MRILRNDSSEKTILQRTLELYEILKFAMLLCIHRKVELESTILLNFLYLLIKDTWCLLAYRYVGWYGIKKKEIQNVIPTCKESQM